MFLSIAQKIENMYKVIFLLEYFNLLPCIENLTSFYFRGTQIWNSLNPTLYAARTLDNFKLLYRSFLCDYVILCVIAILYVACQGTAEKQYFYTEQSSL